MFKNNILFSLTCVFHVVVPYYNTVRSLKHIEHVYIKKARPLYEDNLGYSVVVETHTLLARFN